MVTLPIYMDNNATTRVDPRVVEAMLPYFTERYGNAASRHHSFGVQAAEAVEEARARVAGLIDASPREIVFTSGATESNNLAIKGAAEMYGRQGTHIITAVTEHHAVLDPCRHLEQQGFDVTYLPVDRHGSVSLAQLAQAFTERTILVSIMAANNEIGTLQPVAEIGRLCKERGVLFHTDAVQAVGKVPVSVEAMRVDLLSLSAHKLYGPKGVGALYIRRRNPHVRLQPQMEGGGHERGLRSGTLDVPGVVGLGMACALCQLEMTAEAERLTRLRERLRQAIMNELPDTALNGHPTERLPGNLNFSFAHVQGDALLMALKDVAVSSGSACTSATIEPSYVLRALGIGDARAHSSVRFGLGRFNTEEEVDHAVGAVVRTVNHLRALSPLAEMAGSGSVGAIETGPAAS
jgi:cysteine desulfurase